MLFFIVGFVFFVIILLIVVGHFLPAKVAPCTHTHIIAAQRNLVWNVLHNPEQVSFNGESTRTFDVRKLAKSSEWKEELGGNSVWHWKEHSVNNQNSCVFEALDSVVPLSVKVWRFLDLFVEIYVLFYVELYSNLGDI